MTRRKATPRAATNTADVIAATPVAGSQPSVRDHGRLEHARRPRLQDRGSYALHHFRHENGAIGAADGLARATGEVGWAQGVVHGPGLTERRDRPCAPL